MSRSFREEFVLRSVVLRDGLGPAIVIQKADEWAKACCEAWGHEDDLVAEHDLSDIVIATCQRCGRVTKQDWNDDE